MKLIAISFLLASTFAQAQFITISGIIQDRLTNERLPHTSITVKNRTIGTIANAEGRFTLHIPANLSGDTLYISRIGYEALFLPLKDFTHNTNVIFSLLPATYNLQEIVVTDSLTVEAILRRAYENIKQNYPTRPYSVKGFYREIQKADSSYVSLVEAAVNLYNDGYQSKKKEKLQVEQLRRSLVYEHPVNEFWNTKNLLWHFIQQNFVKYESGGLIKYKRAHRKPDTAIGTIPVYVISIVIEWDFWSSNLYIRQDNYAIIRTEEDFLPSRDGERKWRVPSSPLFDSFPQRKVLQVDYKEYNRKLYPSHYYLHFCTLYKNIVSGEDVLLFSVTQQFSVTDLNENPPTVKSSDALKEDDNLEKLSLPYDTAFWKNYNIIQDTPLDSVVRQDIQRLQEAKP